MSKGNIGVTSENLFPIIKKFLYSDHEIFLREIVSNAVDASQKLKTLASKGEYDGDIENLKVEVKIDAEAGTLTVSDGGLGMNAEEVDRYLNQIAFSGATDFLDKYKDDAAAIIGHFGLGFYSSFMVSDRVEVVSKSYRKDSQAVRWSCDGSPQYDLDDAERETTGTDIIMHIAEDSKEFLEEDRIKSMLDKYCKFLPVEIVFGKEKAWTDGEMKETGNDLIINQTAPAWTKKPADLTDEDYTNFYKDLYPMGEDPLFNIHLNVDYPFKLTGILYFPKIKNSVEIQKNKIQLYSNQVFVTDSVEEIVPEFLTLLHGVIDSPDIPLNVSRSYLQSDHNVKKISNHITKKVADKLEEIFKNDRENFENKWDDLKIFIEYGTLSNEKFAEKAKKYFMYKNVDGKAFTKEEYTELVSSNQTDKDGNLIVLYTNNKDEQFTFIQDAKDKGYDVVLMDSMLTAPLINKFEQEDPKTKFVRVDSDVIENLIAKDDREKAVLTDVQRDELEPVFSAVKPEGEANYIVTFEDLGEAGQPIVVTQNEFMRRMKDMSQIQSGMSMYGNFPDSYNLVVNIAHPLVKQVMDSKDEALSADLAPINLQLEERENERLALEKLKEGKKEEEVPSEEKEKLEEINKEISTLKEEKRGKLTTFGKDNKVAKQLIDLALLANNMLKGEALASFVRRSVELIK